ncbi:MAG: YezD family protein [Candidatus Aureabacteria bacterium]|nr:YezD family protein [Candidatus Auribacterota bacterium]
MSNDPDVITAINKTILMEISAALRNLKFGTVTITVHDSRIAQIEVSEKKRFDNHWRFEKGGGI